MEYAVRAMIFIADCPGRQTTATVAPMKTILPLRLLVQPDRKDTEPLVIYHGRSCPDGFAAALAAKLFYGDAAQYLGLDHGDVKSLADLPPVAGRAVYILDFSFAEDILRGIDAQAAKLVLLDHHQSAAEKLTGFACRCGVVHFDLDKSGARLAWEFFFPDAPVPDLVRFVEDRDIWTWQYPDSAAYLAALDMEPFDFDRWAQIAAFDATTQAEFMGRGQAMDDKLTKLATDIAQDAQPVVFNGVAGLMVNAPGVFHSLVGEMLSTKNGTFALMWHATANEQGGMVKVGLRSQRGFDCIPLASSMGGGGHAQACGFKMPAARLAELLAGSLTAWPQGRGT